MSSILVISSKQCYTNVSKFWVMGNKVKLDMILDVRDSGRSNSDRLHLNGIQC